MYPLIGRILGDAGATIWISNAYDASRQANTMGSKTYKNNLLHFVVFFPFQYRNITPKCNKISRCIVAWSRQTFWFKLNFLLPKNESVLNILVYFLEQFQRFSRIYPKMFSTDFIFRQQEFFVDNQKCQAGFRPLCNKTLLFQN